MHTDTRGEAGHRRWGCRQCADPEYQRVISRVVWNQGNGLKGVTELYLRAVRGEGDSPLFKGVSRKAEKGIHLLLATGEAGSKGTKTLTY